MKFVVFGLTISSSWGNGHATIWRGLCRALQKRGHQVIFFERDVPYYALNRDLFDVPGGELVLYTDWMDIVPLAKKHLSDADVGMVTSYCPDGIAATELVLNSPARLNCFYDLDTPITLQRRRTGERLGYIGPRGLQDFDLVLSYTGGKSLVELQTQLGAKRVAPLYGSVIRRFIVRCKPRIVSGLIFRIWELTPPIDRNTCARFSSSRRSVCPGRNSSSAGRNIRTISRGARTSFLRTTFRRATTRRFIARHF
jgi:hypothetical protein